MLVVGKYCLDVASSLNLQREKEHREKQAQAVRAQQREKRAQHARIRKYYDEYSVRMRGKMLKKRSREELVSERIKPSSCVTCKCCT